MSAEKSPADMTCFSDPADRALADKLRAAVCSEAYEEVLVLLEEYGCRLRRRLQMVAGDRKQAQDLVREANDLLYWARNTVSANRTHAQDKLGQLNQAAGYSLPARNGKSNTWALKG